MNIKLNGKELKKLLKVKYAISKDSTKPVLCGIHFYTKNNKLYSEAIDGFRAAKTNIDFEVINDCDFIINEKDIKEVNKNVKNNSTIEISVDNRKDVKEQINSMQNRVYDLNDEIAKAPAERKVDLFDEQIKLLDEVKELHKIENKKIVTFNIDDFKIDCISIPYDEFINIDKLSYSKYHNDVNEYKINRKDMLTTLKELKKDMMTRKNNLIKLNFNDNKLDMTVTGKDGTKNTITIKCNMVEPLQIAFNIKYLLDLISSYSEKELTIKATTNINMIQIEEDDIKGILLPVRIAKI